MTDRDSAGQIEAVPGPQLQLVPGGAHPPPRFDDLFVEHYGFVCRTLQAMGVDAASVEDLAQDVFIVLHRRLHDYDRARDVRSWLWGIARRTLSTHQRTQRRAQRKLHAIPEPEAATTPDEVLEQRRKAERVRSALDSLGEAHREVFVLTELEGMAAPEIAQATGLKLNTVYSRLRHARSRFAKAMERQRARDRGRERRKGGRDAER